MPKVSEQKTASLPAIRVPEPLYAWVEQEALNEGLNISEFVRLILFTTKRAVR